MSTSTLLQRFVFCVVLLLGSLAAGTGKAQALYGNEWINYSQTYYKIKVANTGIHRLSASYLEGLGLSGVNPQHFQLFRRGREVAIYVAGEQDGRLDAQDFIEFYGERNDGVLDKELYKNPAHQMHQLHSFYTDTAAYFLTFSAAGGKRMRVINPAVDGKTPEPYHLQKVVYTEPGRYYYGKIVGLNRMPWLDEGEGYFSHSSRFAKSYVIATLTNVVTTGPKPRLEYGIGALNPIVHRFAANIVPPTGSPRELARHEINGDGAVKGNAVLEFSDINPQGRITFQTAPDAHETTFNQISFSFSRITFPQQGIFSGNSMFFYTDSTRAAIPYFEFTNTPATVVAYDVTDQGDIARIEGHQNGTTKGFVIPGNTVTRKILLSNATTTFAPVGRAYRVNFRNIQPAAHNYIILTNIRLMKKVGGAANTAPVEYAAYRASEAGGGYDTLLVHMDQVVDQFHYGDFSVNSIRRMMKFMMTSNRAKHLFVLGKGLRYAADLYTSIYGSRWSYYHVGGRFPRVYELDLVPSGIAPVSDVFYTADFHNSSYDPQVPTGRLSATKPEDIINYLNKVKEYEAVPEGVAWRKNILQLGGGKNQTEIAQMSSYLRGYKRIAEGPFLGANVIERYRQNLSEIVENINVANEVNAGLSLITFFGHSSPGTTDLDIGYVSGALSSYRNKGRYPILVMNGCQLGDTFQPNTISFGEDWLNTPDRGAVAMLAHAEAGYATFLNLYTSNFYTIAFQDPVFYGRTLGEIQKETIRRVNRTTSNEYAIAMVTQVVLQGDPAVRPYAPSKPDYLVEGGEFNVTAPDGSLATSDAEAFVIEVNVRNLGKALPDSVNVSIKRTLSDNAVVLTETKVKPVYNRDKLQFTIDNRGVSAEGVNQFEIFLDHTNTFEELNEQNNIGRFQHYFPSSGLLALNPANYGIVNTQKVNLAVQATNPSNTRKSYYFELDTTQLFNSAIKLTQTVTDEVLPVWEANLPNLGADSDSMVYYWRARFEELAEGEDMNWVGGSFRYISNGTYGWSQSHYGQFDKAQTTNIEKLTDNQQLTWQFSPFQSNIEIRTAGGDIRFTADTYGLSVNGEVELGALCSNPFASTTARMFFIVFNNLTLEKVSSIPGFTGCSISPYLFEFGDLNTAANRTRVEDFLKAVPAGYHVAAISVNRVPFESFSDGLKNAFRSIGSSLIGDLKNGFPFAIVGTKGAVAGSANEVTATVQPEAQQSIVLTVPLFSKQPAGTITSSVIGPAQTWTSVHHTVKTNSSDDKYSLRVIGISATGEQQVLYTDVKEKNFDISGINANDYPNLQLSLFVSDTTLRTAPQLKEWLVTYIDNTPEGLVRPDLVTVNEEILTNQAKKGRITIPMAFQNISDFAFSDSVVVEVTLTGEGFQEPQRSRFKIAPIPAHTIARFEHTITTVSLNGNYRVMLFVNPRGEQREKNYSNNVFEVPFRANPRLHPTMDIAFDGAHIMDGDLVSPSPLISITVKDENKGFYLQDPSSMSVVLLTQDGQEIDVDLMNKAEVDYTPADEQNDFKVNYKPTRLENGKYTMVVSARDVAGQATGMNPYRISFEVENETGISNFYPFPNPFSSKTNFIFTLTGTTSIPEFKIQILTVTGKVVKEILKEELGPLKIGNNKTAYAWDGTDTYGDKLANGVYLYRVVMAQADVEMKHRVNADDKSFKNGYGKLYILR